MDLFQRARRVLAPRSILDDQHSNNPQAIPRSYGAITTSPQLRPIQEAPARRRRSRRSRSGAYYDPPRTSCVFRGLIPMRHSSRLLFVSRDTCSGSTGPGHYSACLRRHYWRRRDGCLPASGSLPAHDLPPDLAQAFWPVIINIPYPSPLHSRSDTKTPVHVVGLTPDSR